MVARPAAFPECYWDEQREDFYFLVVMLFIFRLKESNWLSKKRGLTEDWGPSDHVLGNQETPRELEVLKDSIQRVVVTRRGTWNWFPQTEECLSHGGPWAGATLIYRQP